MPKLSWKLALAGAAVLAGTVYVIAAQFAPGGHGSMQGPMDAATHGRLHGQMQHGMHRDGMKGDASTAMPSSPGQDAFGAIQEIVQILEADPQTDWSKVNIDALRAHLIDMNEVTLNARATARLTADGLVIDVTGEGRTLAAIKRMVPAHVRELANQGVNAASEEGADGVTITVASQDALERTRLKALGFMGLMVQGAHHQPHHLMMAKGAFAH